MPRPALSGSLRRMEQTVARQFTPEVLADACARFGAHPEKLVKLGDFENYVFGFDGPGGPSVLRLVHVSHRTARQVRAELHWLAFLAGEGLDVAAPRASLHGTLVETVAADGGTFFASAFERASGEKLGHDDLDEAALRAWGALLADLHDATDRYVPEDPEGRPEWTDEPYVRDRAAHAREVGASPAVLARFDAAVEEVRAAPRRRFGLIHNDVHPGNFLARRDGGDGGPVRLALFDFDDAFRHHHAQDVAMALFYAMPGPHTPDRDERAAFVLRALLAGYRAKRPFGAEDLALFPALLKIRELTIFLLVQRKWDLANLDERQRGMLTRMRDHAEHGVPFSGLDYTAF